VSGEVALEETHGVSGALAFADAACDVILGRRIVASMEDHRAEGAVEWAVAAATEPATDCLPEEAGSGALSDTLRRANRSHRRNALRQCPCNA
jgi:hypothetical protein